jgi:hypothetical protein
MNTPETAYRVTYSAKDGADAFTCTVSGDDLADVPCAIARSQAQLAVLTPDWLREECYFISAVMPA